MFYHAFIMYSVIKLVLLSFSAEITVEWQCTSAKAELPVTLLASEQSAWTSKPLNFVDW